MIDNPDILQYVVEYLNLSDIKKLKCVLREEILSKILNRRFIKLKRYIPFKEFLSTEDKSPIKRLLLVVGEDEFDDQVNLFKDIEKFKVDRRKSSSYFNEYHPSDFYKFKCNNINIIKSVLLTQIISEFTYINLRYQNILRIRNITEKEKSIMYNIDHEYIEMCVKTFVLESDTLNKLKIFSFEVQKFGVTYANNTLSVKCPEE